MKKDKSKARLVLLIVLAYVAGNILLFFVNPFASPWHYHTRNPVPITVATPDDAALSLTRITHILEEIDLAYGARKPTASEQAKFTAMHIVSLVFFPATFALHMKEFVEYIGPANARQQAFTLSVKQRYNHLANLGAVKGMKGEGYLFQEEPSLSKRNAASFDSLRSAASDGKSK